MKQRILIIDDEIDFCSIMNKYFINKEYEVKTANSISSGMQLINSFYPSILVLDNNLPDGDGWEFVDRIVEIIPQVRIYLISAHRDKSSYSGVLKNVSIWEKPITLSTLNNIF